MNLGRRRDTIGARMTRFVLWLGAVLFVPFGLRILLDPMGLAALTERPVRTPIAMTLLTGIALACDARAFGGRHA